MRPRLTHQRAVRCPRLGNTHFLASPTPPVPKAMSPFSRGILSTSPSSVSMLSRWIGRDEQNASMRAMLPLSDRVKGACMNWFLFTYTTVLSTTLKLLSCVSVPGAPHTYLYLNATRDCSSTGWLVPLYVVLVLLVGGCVALPFFTRFLHHSPDKLPGVYRVLTDPYTDECYWWEGALLFPSTPFSRRARCCTCCLAASCALSSKRCT